MDIEEDQKEVDSLDKLNTKNDLSTNLFSEVPFILRGIQQSIASLTDEVKLLRNHLEKSKLPEAEPSIQVDNQIPDPPKRENKEEEVLDFDAFFKDKVR
ncbi:MAG: hypothetical protein HY739_09245 [Desulfobacterales bacterium]|nr:hypothetical protein [Desulfobacterales bacterium]